MEKIENLVEVVDWSMEATYEKPVFMRVCMRVDDTLFVMEPIMCFALINKYLDIYFDTI